MNVLFIMSDEHSHDTMGCAGHPIVRTPVLDGLAREGTRFANCYTPSPLCTPGRASFFTGRYVTELGTWDNATPYDGKLNDIAGQHHRNGETLRAIGKLDLHPDGQYEGLDATMPNYRTNPQFESLFRNRDVDMGNEKRFINMGVCKEPSFDDKVTDLALEWLQKKRESGSKNDWTLYVGLIDPHFPFLADEQRWRYYESLVTEAVIPNSAKGAFSELNEPLRQLRRHFRGDVVDEQTLLNAHIGYYALTDKLDYNIGRILDKLKELGLEKNTLIVYTSDHGEQLGRHGLWWKCCMYEESVHVPLIIKGPGVRRGAIVDEPVSLVDMYPTICDARGIPVPAELPGSSLLPLAMKGADSSRADFAFSEYHAHGVPSGMYMIRWKQWKYVHYVGFEPQLFDLERDPQEMKDLFPQAGQSEELSVVLQQCETRLQSVCNPEETDRRARADQEAARLRLGLDGYRPGKGMPALHPLYSLRS